MLRVVYKTKMVKHEKTTKLILLYRTHKTNKQYSNRSFIYKQMQMLVVVDETFPTVTRTLVSTRNYVGTIHIS